MKYNFALKMNIIIAKAKKKMKKKWMEEESKDCNKEY